MNKKKIRQYSAVLLIVFLIFVFGLSIYFALKGNIGGAISALAFNAFFSVILFFLIKLHRYIKTDYEEENDEKKL